MIETAVTAPSLYGMADLAVGCRVPAAAPCSSGDGGGPGCRPCCSASRGDRGSWATSRACRAGGGWQHRDVRASRPADPPRAHPAERATALAGRAGRSSSPGTPSLRSPCWPAARPSPGVGCRCWSRSPGASGAGRSMHCLSRLLAVALAGPALARVLLPVGGSRSGTPLVRRLPGRRSRVLAARLLRSPRLDVADLVGRPERRPSQSLRDALARAVGDPTLQVAYVAGDGYVDARGSPAELARIAAPHVTPLLRDGRALRFHLPRPCRPRRPAAGGCRRDRGRPHLGERAASGGRGAPGGRGPRVPPTDRDGWSGGAASIRGPTCASAPGHAWTALPRCWTTYPPPARQASSTSLASRSSDARPTCTTWPGACTRWPLRTSGSRRGGRRPRHFGPARRRRRGGRGRAGRRGRRDGVLRLRRGPHQRRPTRGAGRRRSGSCSEPAATSS